MQQKYDIAIINDLVNKIETIKTYEEKNLKMEEELNGAEQVSLLRKVNIAVYENVIGMVKDHFKLDETPTRKRGGGRPRKQPTAASEAAAGTES